MSASAAPLAVAPSRVLGAIIGAAHSAGFHDLASWLETDTAEFTAVLQDMLSVTADGLRFPRLNETVELNSGRGGKKRFIVVSTSPARDYFAAVALSGDEKGSILRGVGYLSIVRILDIEPTWSGKQAAKRYKQYVDLLQKYPERIVPFNDTERIRPPEAARPIAPPSDPEPVDVTIEHTAQAGTVADFPKNRPLFDLLRRFGFVWSHREKVVRRTSSIGLPKPTLDLYSLKIHLNSAGFKVAFDIEVAETEEEVAAALARKVEYLDDRAAATSEMAAKARVRAGTQAEHVSRLIEESITKAPIEGYFPTPPNIVHQLVQVANVHDRMVVLEPSAGHGAIADALRTADSTTVDGGLANPTIDVVEINPELQQQLIRKGYPIVGRDFLTFHPGGLYDRIVMNPPFEDSQDATHVMHAYDLLKPGGRIAAIMSEGPFFRQYKRDAAFREWLDKRDHHTSKLPPAKFGRSGEISTRLVTIDKPRDEAPVPVDEDVLDAIEDARERVPAMAAAATGAPLTIRGGSGGGFMGAARRAVEGIPMGQPILVGHHSERKHRRAVEKARRAMDKAVAEDAKAGRLEGRAVGIERAARRVEASVATAARVADYDEFNTLLAARFQKLKRDAGITQIRQGYRGSGTQIANRQIFMRLPDGHGAEAWLKHGVVTLQGYSNGSEFPDATIRYTLEETPDQVYALIRDHMVAAVGGAPAVVPKPKAIVALIRKHAKKDLGATLVRTNDYGFAIGFGAVRETWSGKRAEREFYVEIRNNDAGALRLLVWNGNPPMDGHAEEVGTPRLRSYPAVAQPRRLALLDIEDATPEQAYAAFAATVRRILTPLPET